MGVLAVIRDQHRAAAQSLAPEALAYIDAGAGDEVSASEAADAWDRYRLRPRVLRDVRLVDSGLAVLGAVLPAPFIVGPTAYQRLASAGAEVEMARGVVAAGGLMVVSTRTSARLEDVAAVGCPWWFQVYVMRDRHLTSSLVTRAVEAGARALVLTGDTPILGRKPRVPHPPVSVGGAVPGEEQDPSITPSVIGWLHEVSGLPVLVKGVLRADDARVCLAAGAGGIVVSNHGGRQLDRVVTTAAALPEVAGAAASAASGAVREAATFVDGGVHDGTSALVALALGARGVLIGRPALWALAAGGASAVADLLAALGEDLRHSMALAGAASMADVDRTLVAGS